jgi:hypothetical protein
LLAAAGARQADRNLFLHKTGMERQFPGDSQDG